MQNYDGNKLEYEAQDEAEGYELEYENDENETASEGEVYDEVEEMELAAELLAVSNEGELDELLGEVMKRAAGDGGKTARSPAGRKLGGFLKGLFGKVLPVAARALGTVVGGPIGGSLAGGAAKAAGRAFGLELEAMSQEDQELEVARRLVRLAGQATRQVSNTPASPDPQEAARKAVLLVARRLAPGLLRPGIDGEVAPPSKVRPPQAGRWLRRGHTIILSGV